MHKLISIHTHTHTHIYIYIYVNIYIYILNKREREREREKERYRVIHESLYHFFYPVSFYLLKLNSYSDINISNNMQIFENYIA